MSKYIFNRDGDFSTGIFKACTFRMERDRLHYSAIRAMRCLIDSEDGFILTSEIETQLIPSFMIDFVTNEPYNDTGVYKLSLNQSYLDSDHVIKSCLNHLSQYIKYIDESSYNRLIDLDPHMVTEARELATDLHEGHFRRDGKTPYITHPIAVSYMATCNYTKVIALLHDTIEDAKVIAKARGVDDVDVEERTANAILESFDHIVLEAVEILTKDHSVPYEDYLRKIKGNRFAKEVKILDMVHNLSQDPTPKQIQKYSKGLLFLSE